MRSTFVLLAAAAVSSAFVICRHRDEAGSASRTEAPHSAGVGAVRRPNVSIEAVGTAVQSPAPPHREAIKASTTAAEAAAQAAAKISNSQ
jgi:hypothetical protein